jgi:hypothetical protein
LLPSGLLEALSSIPSANYILSKLGSVLSAGPIFCEWDRRDFGPAFFRAVLGVNPEILRYSAMRSFDQAPSLRALALV